MKTSIELIELARQDLGIDTRFIRGQDKQVRRCWHFSTDGTNVAGIFNDEADFAAGMNRIFFALQHYEALILAFCLMDTHVHFVLWGEYGECNRFIHEYIRRTSIFMANARGENRWLYSIPVSCQAITDDRYLKTVICYVIKNPPVSGISSMASDYPWSSGPLYFRYPGTWASPAWSDGSYCARPVFGRNEQKRVFHTKEELPQGIRVMSGNLIFPGEYVAVQIVESLFCTCRSFNYFMCISKSGDIESREEIVSRLSIPLRELRQYRDDLSKEYFGAAGLRGLDTSRRLRLARGLRSKYHCSVKQLCRVCGLVWSEVGALI